MRVQCELPRSPACDAVAQRLDRLGVDATRGPLRQHRARRVAAHPRGDVGGAARRHPEARSLEQGPKSSGVFARFTDEGASLSLLDPRGRVANVSPRGAGLVAATRQPGRPPVWFVTGTDAPGVTAAARAFDERVLRNRFAVATEQDARLRVPLTDADGP